MPMGLLEVSGSIDLAQFWPAGTSDADTTKIQVDVAADSFRFRPTPADAFRVTHAFDDAVVVGKTRKPAIDNKGRVTIRLQGIDAPELHYRPSAAKKKSEQTAQQHELYLKWNLEYRQRFGETATIALRGLLQQAGMANFPCVVTSAVDTPNDVFDTYGRMVGDIAVQIAGAPINVNHWLLANGWAVPTFYASMTETEITDLTNLALGAKAGGLGFWPKFTRRIVAFEWDLEFRGKGAIPDAAADRGSVMLPKVFRRQATYQVNKRSKMVAGTFVAYLTAQADGLHQTDEFLQQGPAAAPVHFLNEYVVGHQFKADPWGIVFREKPSRVRHADGSEVTWW